MKRLHNISANADMSDDQVKFFYKGEFLGSCDPEYMECDKLYELIKSDSRAATQVLNYMNSLGDPVFPTKEGGYEPETDVSKVDPLELYNTFMQELDYSYRDFPKDFYVGGDYIIPDFEIFIDSSDEIVTSTKIKASRYDNVPGYKAPKGGYLYIFKHGIGPGTMPKDVEIIKTKDLPNYYTAVWLSDFLTTDELKKYDIPDETRINSILDSIGYCQKNGDVVPCGDVEACGKVTASNKTRYMANMVSASSSDSRYDENDELYKYYVAGYFDSNLRGLEDNLATHDFDEALDFAHKLASNGDYVEITNEITGKSHTYSPDEWMEAIEFGEVPSSTKDLY